MWRVTVIGRDDVHEYETELEALQMANGVNIAAAHLRETSPDDDTTLVVAVVEEVSAKACDDVPRRADLARNSSAELAIYDAMLEVEEMGADVRLTDAVIALSEARSHVADFVDGIPRTEPFA